MDASKLVFLLSPDTRLIRAAYEPITADMEKMGAGVAPKTYSFKTLDQSMKVGDFVVVETATRFGLTICKVTEVDLEVDFDDGISLKWAFFPIDLAVVEHIRAREAEAISAARRAELRKKREELAASMFKDAEEMAKLPAISMDPNPSVTE